MPISTGYGFIPVQLLGGRPQSGGTIREIPVTPAAATNPICSGDLVNTSAGVALTVAAAPAAGTSSANTPVGACVGVRFVDPVLRQPQFAQSLPANSTGYTQIFARVVDDPDAIMQVRYDGALTSTSVGLNCTITFVAGNPITGNAKLYASGVATTATLPFRIVEIIGGGIDPGTLTAFTDILVTYNVGTHAYRIATGR